LSALLDEAATRRSRKPASHELLFTITSLYFVGGDFA
jgi:hypothetical protein